jgi:predicted PurR-regulated permease PerM
VGKATVVPPWQRALVVLTNTVVGVVIVLALYWAQLVFIPVALAIYLAFLLTPPVRALQRRGFGRLPSIFAVVLGAALLLCGFGWLVGNQVSGLVTKLPDYSVNLHDKIRSLRQLGSGSERLEKLIEELSSELRSEPLPADPTGKGAAPQPRDAGAGTDGPRAVLVRKPEMPLWLAWLPAYFRSTLEALGGLALVLVLAIFVLFKREDLRNRFIRLIGHDHMSFTTKAVDDASLRISRYLIMQAVVNCAFGLAVALGLFLIGIDYPLLWGLLAALLRYVPYVGTWVAALFPITLSLAIYSDWWRPLATLGFFLTLELVTANVFEPRLFGQSMGVSEVALLVMAAFYAFLWGPIGLILAAPFTVCLAVLGKYVPGLGFLDVLLGDGPALESAVSYYQRLLARDQDEAVELVLSHCQNEPPELAYDKLLVPALNHAKRDRHREELTDDDERFVRQTTWEILEDLGERLIEAAPSEAAARLPRVRILGCPAQDESDRLALEMLRQLLDPERCQLELTEVDLLAAELVERVAQFQPALICIASLPPGGFAHSRYLCKRLRSRFPEVKIVVGRFGLRAHTERDEKRLQEAGASEMTATLLEMRDRIAALLPVLADRSAANGRQSAARGRQSAVGTTTC